MDRTAYKRDWYAKNRTEQQQKARAWYVKDLDANRHKRRTNNQRNRNRIVVLLGNKCLTCGFDDARALQVDHIQGNGRVERKTLAHSNSAFYRLIYASVAAGDKKYQLLCANCNWIKRETNGELRWQ